MVDPFALLLERNSSMLMLLAGFLFTDDLGMLLKLLEL